MKKILLFACISVSLTAVAQTVNPTFFDSIINRSVLKIPTYYLSTTSQEYKFFRMPFGKSEFTDTAGIGQLQQVEILSVDLVFTDYPSNLDLKQLNKNRFITLSKYLPNALKSKYTQWQVFRQMDGKDKETAKSMLHGFVVNYRPKPDAASMKREIDFLKSITPTVTYIDETPAPKKEKIRHWEAIHNGKNKPVVYVGDRPVVAFHTQKQQLIPDKTDSIAVYTPQQAYELKIITGREKEIHPTKDSVYVLLGKPLSNEGSILKKVEKPSTNIYLDSTLKAVLRRNKFSNLLIVADVTGSMSPYNAQVIDWLTNEANSSNLKALVCFNDGDAKKTEEKAIGNTGGIYGSDFIDVSQISDLMQEAMNNGSGGDYPENVCEAIIKAIEMYSNYENVVLLADSWAPVRDMRLLYRIKKPVHIIACGDFAPHADYVGIAFFTGGTLHLKDVDVKDFSMLQAGGTITIKGRNYKLQEGKIVTY